MVKGEKCENDTRTKIKQNKVKKLGIVLLCVGFLLLLLVGLTTNSKLSLMIFLPILVCGLICLYGKRNSDLWCGWSIYLLIDIYICILSFPIPVRWKYIIWWNYDTILKHQLIFIASWLACLLFLGLTILTVHRFRKPIEIAKHDLFLLIGGWLIYFYYVHGQLINIVLTGLNINSLRFHILYIVISNFKLLCFEVLLVCTLRYINTKRKEYIKQ